jgi:oligosaccharide repeat unit polymerase
MLIVLLIITAIFLVLNFNLSGKDIADPGFLYCLSFFVFEFICFLGTTAYDVVINTETVLVVSFGMLCITCVSLFAHRKQKCYQFVPDDGKSYDLSNIVVAIVIFIQCITIVTFINYIFRLYAVCTGAEGSLSDAINNYDQLVKFNTTRLDSLNVDIGELYRKTNLVSNSVPYVILFVLINNIYYFKRFNLLQSFSVLLLAIQTVLTGGRSGLFLMFTFVIIELAIISFRKAFIKGVGLRIFVRITIVVIITGFALILVMKIMGRSLPSNLAEYIFVYFGAPIDNLDNYIARGAPTVHTDVPGEYTFNGIYRYFYDKGMLNSIGRVTDVLPFVSSSNGKNEGNVFTMFYFWLIDFGFVGLFPLMLVYSFSYIYVYRSIYKNYQGKFNYSLFIYAYIINSLIMSPFSNRFFEEIITISFAKKAIITFLFVVLFIDKRFEIFDNQFRFDYKEIKRTDCKL